ncbi:uncharacterized protein LOC141851881 isoform X1 [Brevipalpus obovatus]|uniref:uncharacterized protein LOC141851881 isoform X1 n=1 Tax=Brevipalpus obovatus TaxID=246614 RepID=UPI003D9E7BE7
MSEYWKSLPKKYCDICKCWFADNKSSVEFHERGLRHKNNVQKKLAQLQKDGVKEQKSIDKYNSDIMKIEAAAMSAFAKDVINDPKRAKEYGASVSLTDKLKVSEKKSQPTVTVNRFGFDDSEKTEQYQNLGREKALEAITSKMEKKAQWLESKTGEGVSFYWNRKTLDTKWEPPKEGFMSIEEQQRLGMSTTTGPINSAGQPETLKYNPLGQWRTVEEKHDSEEDIDFQLPKKRRELSKDRILCIRISYLLLLNLVSVYESDFFGNDVVHGYGAAHVTSISGHHERQIAAFVPKSSSLLNAFQTWFTGKRAEFLDSRIVAQGNDRSIVRVSTQGMVKVEMDIILKDFHKHGYKNK